MSVTDEDPLGSVCPMRIDELSEGDALKSLKSTPQGLANSEAQRRLSEYGPNQIEPVRAPTRCCGYCGNSYTSLH